MAAHFYPESCPGIPFSSARCNAINDSREWLRAGEGACCSFGAGDGFFLSLLNTRFIQRCSNGG